LSDFFANAVPYFLTGAVIYLLFRSVIWILYYKGEMRCPLWHEVGFFLLAFWFLMIFAGSITPALGFSIKPSFQDVCLIPVKGTMGGIMAIRDSRILNGKYALAYYEDGHNGGNLLLNDEVNNGRITWAVLDHTKL